MPLVSLLMMLEDIAWKKDFLRSEYVDNSGLQLVQNDNKLHQKGKTNALATRKGFIVHTTILLW